MLEVKIIEMFVLGHELSIKDIADKLSVSEEDVNRAITRLHNAGVIMKVEP